MLHRPVHVKDEQQQMSAQHSSATVEQAVMHTAAASEQDNACAGLAM
jgi:hypothetical protein